MLCITRHLNDTVEIGKAGDVLSGPIVLTINELFKHRVRLGVEAQLNVRVLRGEVARSLRNDRTNPQFTAQTTGITADGCTQGREVKASQIEGCEKGQDVQETQAGGEVNHV